MSDFYVTTPIYYVNALPHLGTFYTTVVADALARYHRARNGRQATFFLTGTDEHGQKIERIAAERGLPPAAYCDQIVDSYKQAWQRIDASYDRFIRTTDADHVTAVREMWQRMVKAGDIYEGEYDGLYCVGCEDRKTEEEVVAGPGGEKLCPVHNKPVEHVKEKNYFFRLSKYGDRLLAHYDANPDFIRPRSRRNEVAEFVKGGLRDLSVSRSAVKWGIPVPGDDAHTIYVWVDALTNYVTAVGGPEAAGASTGERGHFWRAAHHLIAKDILRFHAVYWPAFLMSAGLPLPQGVFCHGYLTVRGQKISKSIPATRVDPMAISQALGSADPLRYFVLREYPLGGDGDFTYEALFGRTEADLGNDLGNLLNRTVAMAQRYRTGEVPAWTPSAADRDLPELAAARLPDIQAHWEAFAPSRALETTWELIRAANAYIDRSAPWTLAKDPAKAGELAMVLANACEALRWAAMLVAPAMPERTRELLRQLGREQDEGHWPQKWGWPGGQVKEPQPLFPRIEPERQSALIAGWTQAAPAAPAATPTPAAAASPGPAAKPASAPAAEITREEFQRMDLRAAKVLTAERVPKTDKLLKMTLDLGGEQRTVVSGIAGRYSPEQMVGRTVIYLANLKPAKIRGVMSQGMILAASGETGDILGLSATDTDVPPGAKIN